MKGKTIGIALLVGLSTLLLLPFQAFAQKTIEAKGMVTDKEGQPLAGVKVYAQEFTGYSVTDVAGTFAISVPLNVQLTLELDGYRPLHVKVLDEEYLKLVMAKAAEGQGINDVVYLPWRITDKRSNTASVSMTTSEKMDKSPVTSISNTLAGRLPGLGTIQNTGDPGYDGVFWRIRGYRTLEDVGYNNMPKGGDGEPLLVVDGFVRSFNGFDISEIETVSVLKDAAATAIYGARAANGVIMVTTKRGNSGRRNIRLEMNNGLITPTRMPKFLDAVQYATLYNEARRNDGMEELYTQEDINLYRSGGDPLGHPDNDYYKEFVGNAAWQSKGSLNISGGDNIVKYFIAFAYAHQGSLLKRLGEDSDINSKNDYNRYNTRINLDVNLAKRWDAKFNIGGRIEDRNYPYAGVNPIFGAMATTPPNAYPIEFQGIHPELNLETHMLGGNSTYRRNLLGMTSYEGVTENIRKYYQFGVALKHDMDYLLPGLTANMEYNFDGYLSKTDYKSRTYLVWEPTKLPDGSMKYTPFNQETSLSRSSRSDNMHWKGLNVYFAYDNTFGDHGINAMLMYRRNTTLYPEANQPDYKVEDYVLRGSYSFKNRYFVDVTTAYSGTENFYHTPDRRVLYPAVSAGWIISDESFFPKNDNFSFLKLRASWGLTGNDNYKFYDGNGYMYRYVYRDRWWSMSQQHYFGLSAGMQPFITFEGTMPNDNFKIEKSSMANIGLETYFLRNRLKLEFDYFHDKRFDIYTRGAGSLPNYLGILEKNLPIENKGNVTAQGIELKASWQDNIGTFSYALNGYLDYNKSKINNMAEPYKEYPNLVETGGVVGQYFGLISEGLFKDEADIAKSPKQLFGPYQPGDIKYKDVNGDNVIDANDYCSLGKGAFPKMFYGMDILLAYKGFDLSAMLQGSALNSQYIRNAVLNPFLDNGTASEKALGRYTDAASWGNATMPRLSTLDVANNNRLSTYWLKDVWFLRLKNLELGYTFSKIGLSPSTAINKMRIYVNAYNLLTFDNTEEFDPEQPNSGISGYPQTKIFNFGVVFNF